MAEEIYNQGENDTIKTKQSLIYVIQIICLISRDFSQRNAETMAIFDCSILALQYIKKT